MREQALLAVIVMASTLSMNTWAAKKSKDAKRGKKAPQYLIENNSPTTSMDKAWNLWASGNLSSNFNQADYERSLDSTFEAGGSYKLTPDFKLTSYFAVIKDYQGERKTQVQNGYLGQQYSAYQFADSKGKVILESRGYLPLNKKARENQGLITRLYAAPKVIYSFGIVTATAKSALAKNIHSYRQAKDGSSNTSWIWTNSLNVDFQLLPKLSFSTYFLNSHSWNYNKRRLPDVFEMGQSLDYSVDDNWTLSLGHTIGGNTFKSNGVDSNFKIFDKRESTFYSAISCSF